MTDFILITWKKKNLEINLLQKCFGFVFRQNLLLQAAKKLNCTKIFTAETQTDLATKIIANISLGKGAHVPLDVVMKPIKTSIA